MADHHAREFEESFMSVSAFLVAHAQAAQVMEPGASALDNPAAFAKSAAMRNTPLGQQRFDATPPKFLRKANALLFDGAANRKRGRLARLEGACAGGPLYH